MNLLFIGDGPQAEQIRTSIDTGCGAVTGFVINRNCHRIITRPTFSCFQAQRKRGALSSTRRWRHAYSQLPWSALAPLPISLKVSAKSIRVAMSRASQSAQSGSDADKIPRRSRPSAAACCLLQPRPDGFRL